MSEKKPAPQPRPSQLPRHKNATPVGFSAYGCAAEGVLHFALWLGAVPAVFGRGPFRFPGAPDNADNGKIKPRGFQVTFLSLLPLTEPPGRVQAWTRTSKKGKTAPYQGQPP